MRNRRIIVIFIALFVAGCVGFAYSQEITVNRGDKANVSLNYQNSWTIEFDGEFKAAKYKRWVADRYIMDSSGNNSIDLFDGGRFRLGNRKVYFLSASKGKVVNPGAESDHWAEIGSIKGRHCVQICFYAADKRCSVTVDGALRGDFKLRIRKTPVLRSLDFPGFAGKVRVVSGGSAGGVTGGGGMDDVLGGAGNAGKKEFEAPSAGTVTMTAKLSTYNPAKLEVTIQAGGKDRQWLLWRRQGGSDPSPLYVDGKARADSMFERKPGDFSPNVTVVSTKVEKGTKIIYSLEGDFGDGTPILKLDFKAQGN